MLNRVIRKPSLFDIVRQQDGKLAIGRFCNLPDMSLNASLTPSAVFLGPDADNHRVLAELAGDAIESIVNFRTQIWEGPSIQEDQSHQHSIELLKLRFKELLQFLADHSTPFSSLRYLAHMTGDQLLPALAAYYAGMIFNANNVTIQASTATTLLEMLAMRDLCDMVGFTRSAVFYGKDTEQTGHITDPWANIVSDGSIANIESLWSAREAKALPFAIREALIYEPRLTKAAAIEVATCDGKIVNLRDADSWQLWNLTRDERLAIPYQIAEITGFEDYEVWSILAKYNINAMGWQSFTQYFHQWPIVLIPSTAHYSWPKASAVLGLGTVNAQQVMVDKYGRMKMADLCRKLDQALENKQPILMTVSVFGSTEESAVDPLSEILTIRNDYRQKGLDFDIHVDAAWGGYFLSVIRKTFKMENTKEQIVEPAVIDPFLEDTSQVLLSDYVIRHAKKIRCVDSITIDPHKMGYVQYPAGTILYKNGDVINLTTFTGSYIGSPSDPPVGLFGLEGSRPGAAAAAVYFTHACLRPDHKGYGELITRSLYNAKQFYAELMFIGHPQQFKTILLMPYDASIRPLVEQRILRKHLDEIRRDPIALKVFRELGPDQNIVDYGFNPVLAGKVNTDAGVYNAFIATVYNELRIQYNQPTPSENATLNRPELMLSMTTFNIRDYGEEFIANFANQLGLDISAGLPTNLNCLRSTIMNVFTSNIKETSNQGSYWPTIIEAFASSVARLI